LDTPSDSAFKVVWKKVGHKHETERIKCGKVDKLK